VNRERISFIDSKKLKKKFAGLDTPKILQS